jgi:hypothetical protein
VQKVRNAAVLLAARAFADVGTGESGVAIGQRRLH